MSLRVSDIASAAEGTGWLSSDDFRRLTHVRGTRNAHLAEPGGYDGKTARYLERHAPLPLDADVFGEFVTLDYCGHGPWAILDDHDSLQALERVILSSAGVLNTFTTFVVAFVNGQFRNYEVRDRLGRVLAKNGSFIPGSTTEMSVDPTHCRVVWL